MGCCMGAVEEPQVLRLLPVPAGDYQAFASWSEDHDINVRIVKRNILGLVPDS